MAFVFWKSESSNRAKLEQTARNPPNLPWGAAAAQPPVWTDVLAEMSRHIYIRNKIGEGIQAPIFQVKPVSALHTPPVLKLKSAVESI